MSEIPGPNLKDSLVGKQKEIARIAHRIASRSWFRTRTLEFAQDHIGNINHGITNLRDVVTQLGYSQGDSISHINNEVKRDINQNLGRQRVSELGVAVGFSDHVVIAGLEKALGIKRTDIPYQLKERAKEAQKTITRAACHEEITRRNLARKSEPNFNLAVLRLYDEGAFEVTSVNVGERQLIAVHFPLRINGVNYLLCHQEGTKKPSLFHGWEEDCQKAVDEERVWEETETSTPEDIRRRIEEQNQRAISPIK